MNQQCVNCGQNFEITDSDLKFYEHMKVPNPVECPLCREQRRISFRNEKNLYLRICGNCKKQMVSIYSPDKAYNVYCAPCWWSDAWDPVNVGRDFDFNRPFFEQFDELIKASKLINLFVEHNQNSDYVNQETDDKNCYLNAGGHYNEDCYYNTYSIWGKNNVDNYWVIKSELCYECINCENCNRSTYLQDCLNCSDCHYCRECTGCNFCIGCFGLKHKEYYFFNEKLSHEEYGNKAKEYLKNRSAREEAKEKSRQNFLKFPHRAAKIINCENVTGDYLLGCKDVYEGYLIDNSRDVKYAYIGLDIKDGRDLSSYGWGEVLFNCASSMKDSFCLAVSSTCNVHFSQYCFVCYNSSNLFGCVGLNHKQYCILNKQYTKEEYENLLQRIIEHMTKSKEYGQFFPIKISPFCYNETIAQEYFPLTKEQAIDKDYKWKDADSKEYVKQTYQILEDIKNTPENILNEVLACADCSKNYKVMKEELKFYRRMDLPAPLKCPTCRHKNRLKLRNPHRLYERKCQKCETEIKTTYSPERLPTGQAGPEIVYCEKCYLETVY